MKFSYSIWFGGRGRDGQTKGFSYSFCEMLSIMAVIGVLSLVTVTEALSLSRVVVPSYKFAGESAVLECSFDLSAKKRERLYAVKWYKDDAEFFRYVQKSTPPIYTPPVVGIQVHIGGSDAKQVTLRNLDLRSTGVYRCEVSAEAPSFASDHGEGRMTVVHLPEEGPQIKGKLKEEYEVGDILELNCTTSKSFPPAKLYWFINDKPVPKNYTMDFGTSIILSDESSPGPTSYHSSNYYSSSSGYRDRDRDHQHQHHHYDPSGSSSSSIRSSSRTNIGLGTLTSPRIIHHLAPSLSSLRIPLDDSHFTDEGESKVLCKANISPSIFWQDGDEKVVSPRKTDLRSTTNFNASPITLFDQDAQITLRGSSWSIHGGICKLFSLVLSLQILIWYVAW